MSPSAEDVLQLLEPVDQHIGFGQSKLLGGAKPESNSAGSSAGASPGVDVVFAVADHHRIGRRCAQKLDRLENRPRIRLARGNSVAADDLIEEVCDFKVLEENPCEAYLLACDQRLWFAREEPESLGNVWVESRGLQHLVRIVLV